MQRGKAALKVTYPFYTRTDSDGTVVADKLNGDHITGFRKAEDVIEGSDLVNLYARIQNHKHDRQNLKRDFKDDIRKFGEKIQGRKKAIEAINDIERQLEDDLERIECALRQITTNGQKFEIRKDLLSKESRDLLVE